MLDVDGCNINKARMNIRASEYRDESNGYSGTRQRVKKECWTILVFFSLKTPHDAIGRERVP